MLPRYLSPPVGSGALHPPSIPDVARLRLLFLLLSVVLPVSSFDLFKDSASEFIQLSHRFRFHFPLVLTISFLPLALGLFCSSFSTFRQKLRSHFHFLTQSLNSAMAPEHRFRQTVHIPRQTWGGLLEPRLLLVSMEALSRLPLCLSLPRWHAPSIRVT